MSGPRSVLAWYRFLDAPTAEEAAAVVRRQWLALQDAYGTITDAWRVFRECPDEDVEASLWVARAAMDEALEGLEVVAHRLHTVERDAS